MPSEPRAALYFWSLFRVYAATFDILVEANLQLPRAVMGEWAQLARL